MPAEFGIQNKSRPSPHGTKSHPLSDGEGLGASEGELDGATVPVGVVDGLVDGALDSVGWWLGSALGISLHAVPSKISSQSDSLPPTTPYMPVLLA